MPEAQPKDALDAWWHFFGLLRGEADLAADRAAAEQAWAAARDPAEQERVQRRIVHLKSALDIQRRGEWAEAEATTGGGVPGGTP